MDIGRTIGANQNQPNPAELDFSSPPNGVGVEDMGDRRQKVCVKRQLSHDCRSRVAVPHLEMRSVTPDDVTAT